MSSMCHMFLMRKLYLKEVSQVVEPGFELRRLQFSLFLLHQCFPNSEMLIDATGKGFLVMIQLGKCSPLEDAQCTSLY